MHSHSLGNWQHDHRFLGERHEHHERRTWIVVGLASAMMVAEVVGGYLFGSMALIADGWHNSTHAAALGIAGVAYMLARRHVGSTRFSLGTGKFGDLAAFASAVILAMIALDVGYESILRIFRPVAIHYGEAIPIATLGLGVNLTSAWLLGHGHGHDEPPAAQHAHRHDTNLRAAYIHVLADAVTSLLAIGGLSAAWLFGWPWIDPAVALVGMAVILSWAYGLVRSAGAVLLDAIPDEQLMRLVRERIELQGDRLSDLHLWQVGPGHAALIATVVSDHPQPPSVYKDRLRDIAGLSHVTIEVQRCETHAAG